MDPPGLDFNNHRRHSRSQSVDISQIEMERIAARRARAQAPPTATAAAAAAAVRFEAPRPRAREGVVSPRSPRSAASVHAHIRKPAPAAATAAAKKRHEGPLAERSPEPVQTASDGRRYVDPTHDSVAKKSHRRSHSLNARGLQKQREREQQASHGAPAAGVVSNVSQPLLRASATPSTRSSQLARKPAPPAATSRKPSSLRGVHINSLPSNTPEAGAVPNKLKTRHEHLGHRRANSWASNKEDDEPRAPSSSRKAATGSKTALENALAARKAELAQKERLLMERQSRQEAELLTLAEGMAVEHEVEELLRLQRKLSHNLGSSKPVYRFDAAAEHAAVSSPDDVLLDELNDELAALKERTLRIENRVKELRCPGPTPLEMLTGMSQPSRDTAIGPSSASDMPFALPSNVKRVTARRSPPAAPGSTSRAESPSQEFAVSLSSPFGKSAFTSLQ